MKIRARVRSVAQGGATLDIEAVGCEVSAGEWADDHPIRFTVRDLEVHRNTFRVGRELIITVEAK